jgi:hypothetical protein
MTGYWGHFVISIAIPLVIALSILLRARHNDRETARERNATPGDRRGTSDRTPRANSAMAHEI